MNQSIIISYCLFTPKSLHKDMRFWDAYNSFDRYWYNIPSAILINSIVYPEAEIHLHHSKELKNQYFFSLLEKISKKFNLKLIEMPYDFTNTEPTMWRYKPIFDKEADAVLCRDIDSLPTEDEVRATYYFLNNSKFLAHTIRSHTNHATPPTIILAGLCGFRPKLISFLNQITFDIYYNHFKSSNWGLDQNSLINLFIRDSNWTLNHFLDSPLNSKSHRVGKCLIPSTSLDESFYQQNIDINFIPEEILSLLNQETSWAGEPTNFRGDKLKSLLEMDFKLCHDMKEIIESDDALKNFYYNV